MMVQRTNRYTHMELRFAAIRCALCCKSSTGPSLQMLDVVRAVVYHRSLPRL